MDVCFQVGKQTNRPDIYITNSCRVAALDELSNPTAANKAAVFWGGKHSLRVCLWFSLVPQKPEKSAIMDDFSSISLLSLAMLVGCYVAGTIPLAVNFSEVSVMPGNDCSLKRPCLVTGMEAPRWCFCCIHYWLYDRSASVSGPSVRGCADLWVVVQEKLKLVTVLGAGLLCGTALAVIIPEGVHALYEEILEGKVHTITNTCTP